MADGRKNNGGHSTKGRAGRKPKADELALIAKMDANINGEDWDLVIKKIFEEAKNGSYNHIKLLLEYRFGKPKDHLTIKDVTKEKPPSILFFKNYSNKEEE